MGKLLHRVVTDEDIHSACLWRLAGFPPEVIEAATAAMAQIIAGDIPLESDQPEIAGVMAMLNRPNDRRGEWTALMAVAALYADSQGYARLFLVAGFEVVASWKNAKARTDCKPSLPGVSLLQAWPVKKAA